MTAQTTYPSPFARIDAPSQLSRVVALTWPLAGVLNFARNEVLPLIVRMTGVAQADMIAKVSPDTLKRFQTTIVPHLDSAYNFARFLCRDPDAAGDIVQEAFLRAYRSFEAYRGGDARAWMFAIIRNCHRAWLAEGRHRAHFETSMTAGDGRPDDEPLAHRIASEADTPETTTIQQSESAQVREVIGGLSEPMREILVLRELEDLSYRQIAEIIDAPIGTVMSRLARARAEFAEAWQAMAAREVAR
jgi:RNA polymerase sigma-70 factor (ECF subfamily)